MSIISYFGGKANFQSFITPNIPTDCKTYVEPFSGSFAIYLEPHHGDVYEFLEAKKNTGPDELRARDLFYALWVSNCILLNRCYRSKIKKYHNCKIYI